MKLISTDKRSEKKILFENSISIALTQLITYIIPLISLPYLSRVLGVENFGLVFWAQSCITYFMLITEYGFGYSAVREIAINRDDNSKVSDIFNAVMGVKVILIFFSFILLTCLILVFPKFNSEWKLFYLTFLMVIGNAIYPMWYFQGIEHMKYITFLKITSQSVFLILIFIFVKHPEDYCYVAALNSLGFLISGLLGIYIAVKRFGLKLFIPKWQDVKYQLKHSFEFFTARISGTIYTNTNSFVLGLIASPTLVAYYAAAEKIFYAIHMLTSPIGDSLYPHISKTKNVSLYKKIFFPSLIFVFIICITVYLIAPQLVVLFYGTEMINAYKILRIFCITVLVSSISGLIGYPLVAAMGYTKIVNLSLTAAAVVHSCVLLLLYMLHRLNITTIAISTIIPYSVMLVMRLYASFKYNLWNYKKGENNV